MQHLNPASLKHKDAKSRASILKAAERLFARQGFKSTTLRDISSKSGSNGALVSYYFGGKEGLRDAVIENKIQSLSHLWAPLTEKQKNMTSEDLAKAVRILFQHVREDECFHRLALRTLLESNKNVLAEKIFQPFFEKMAEFIRMASGNKISRKESEVRALVIWGMVHQYANLRCFFKDQLNGEQSSEERLMAYENYVAESIVTEICRA